LFYITQIVQRFKSSEKGQALTEYGLILALVAVALVVVLGLLGDNLVTVFTGIKDNIVPPTPSS